MLFHKLKLSHYNNNKYYINQQFKLLYNQQQDKYKHNKLLNHYNKYNKLHW